MTVEPTARFIPDGATRVRAEVDRVDAEAVINTTDFMELSEGGQLLFVDGGCG